MLGLTCLDASTISCLNCSWLQVWTLFPLELRQELRQENRAQIELELLDIFLLKHIAMCLTSSRPPVIFTHITARCITNSRGLAFLPGTHPHLKRSLQENIKTWSFTFVLWCSMGSYRFEIILAFQSNHNSSNGWVSPTAGECHPAQCTIQLSPHMNAQHALCRENYVGFLFWYGLILVLPRFHHILILFWSSWIMGTARHENYLKPLIVGKLDLGWTLSRP